ncbi:MAG: HNH endonuclease [Ruminococcus flavefaciens]|nr:HNH endonuclease [Ruminococcus flavefaciens]
MYDLSTFYQSKEWEAFRKVVIMERLNECGETICEYCGRPIIKSYDIIAHHKEYLTEQNVNNAMIALNPENIALVHHVCHNRIHDKLGRRQQKVYIVYGPPLSGKTTYVKNIITSGDLVIDMDSIWQCVSGQERYKKDGRLNAVVFGVRNNLLEAVKYRRGKWSNAYIIGGYPLSGERNRLVKELGAELIRLPATKEECMCRLDVDDSRDKKEWENYIEDWFDKFIPPACEETEDMENC